MAKIKVKVCYSKTEEIEIDEGLYNNLDKFSKELQEETLLTYVINQTNESSSDLTLISDERMYL